MVGSVETDMTRRLWKARTDNQIRMTAAAAALIMSILMVVLNIAIYQRYRGTLIRTEQEELLTMARTIGTSLQQNMEQEMDKIDLGMELEAAAGTSEAEYDGIKAAAQTILRESDGLYTGTGLVRDGEILFYDGRISADFLSCAAKAKQKASIVGKYLGEEGWYEIVIGKSLSSGTVLFVMNLNKIYKKIVLPVRIGSGGYSVVKDSDLAIIMHHAKSQIGMDALYDREEKYPQLDLSSLERWLDLQRSQPEGTGILDSYVWDDPALKPVRRIVAYTSIDLRGEKWIVNSTLPIMELSAPLRQMLFSMGILGTGYLAVLILILSMFTGAMDRSRQQRKEIEYLRQINRGMELIARKNEEIRHYQRVQSMGMMSSHIAHEFNNYLTPVMLYGEMLEADESISEDNREMLREMLGSVEQAAKLSRELLNFSRMDTGSKREAVNLSEETEEAASIIRQLAPSEVTVETKIQKTPAWITGRKGMMQHILMNLSKNAFHAMEQTQEKKLRVLYRVEDPDSMDNSAGGRVCAPCAVLCVEDTGCGISSENMDSIFEPFYTTKGSRQGTGLGLSVVRSLVENAGGTIEVKSIPGQGTTFIMCFPADYKPAGPGMPAAGAAGENADPEQAGNAIRRGGIVCVCRGRESVKPWRAWLQKQKGTISYTTHEASLYAQLQDDPDFCSHLIIENMLETMKGIEMAQIVRREKRGIHITLLAGADDGGMDWYLDNGIIDEIIRPDPS